jgi:rubredoxin
MRPIVRPWRCFALCWSGGDEVPAQPATRFEVERPLHWACPACDVRWVAYADRVEVPAPVLAS